jgi:hypothetical protein
MEENDVEQNLDYDLYEGTVSREFFSQEMN